MQAGGGPYISRGGLFQDRLVQGQVSDRPPQPSVLGLQLDIDDVPEPDCLTFAAEPEAGVEHVLELLPEPFADASCWWQATSSAGLKPGIRCRLWFWLSRPVSDGEAKGWLARHPVDRSIFTPVAPHYMAPPILAPGMADPVIRRCGVRHGLDDTVRCRRCCRWSRPWPPARSALDGDELTADELVALAAAVRPRRSVRGDLGR